MASMTTFTSLAVPAPDDTMEMSSPANRPLDDDIDIDFDDYTGGVHVDDDQMIEDGQTRPGTGTDDVMEDDPVHSIQAEAQEEIMQDGDEQAVLQEEDDDDELIDYGDEDFQDEAHEDATLVGTVGSELGQENAHTPEVSAAGLTGGAVSTPPQQDASRSAEVLPPSSITAEEVAYDEGGHAASPTIVETETASFDGNAHEITDDVQASQHAAVAEDDAESTEDNTPGTPTDTGLHPMTVRYGDLQIPLFKSQRQPDGLLKDDNLASVSLAELMKHCRQRLAIKIGEDLSEDQELHLGFDRLGLLLVEDSRVAFESSLNEVLEVYLQLQRNDGLDEIPPLSLTLSLQLKFASSLSILKQAAASGQGMSTFGFLSGKEDDEYYQEQYEYGEGTEFPGDEHAAEEFQEQHVIDAGEGEYNNHEETTKEDQAHDETEAADREYDEEYYHEDQVYFEEEPTEDGQIQPPPGIEDILHGEQQSTHALYNAPHDPAETLGQEPNTDESAAQAESASQVPGEAASTVSSATVEGDSAVNNTGEYDLIDWDDDALTSEPSDGTSAEHEDFSTFLTELGDEEATEEATARNVEQVLSGGAAVEQVNSIPADEHTLGAYDEQQETDDFLHELAEDQYQHEGDETHAPGEEYDEREDQDYDQADTYDEQQEEHHADFGPGADDEQFHTAQDFLNGSYYEHGPEHDVYDGAEDGLDDTVETVVHHTVDGDEEHEATDDFDFDEPADPADQSEQLYTSSPGTVKGKRSFDDHIDFDQDDEERDVKKARAV